MLKHERGTRLGEDIEELHDMRVATRRMRAAFGVFGNGFSKKKTKPLLSGLKGTGRALGPVRDLDVFMEKLQHHRQSLPQSDEPDGLQTLLNIWETKRTEARKQMLAYLDRKKYGKFKRNFLEFVETEGLGAKPIPQEIPPVPYQLRHIVPGLIYTAYDEVRAYETVLDNAPIETLHQLRITFKRLRYTFEFLQEILGDGKEMVIEEIKAMQDHLGDLNDADVASTILQDFLLEWENHQLHLPLSERQSPVQIIDYLNIQINKRHHLVTTFPEVWEHFNRPEFRKNLARAISIL
jgi:CHAD domain-containing protein